MKKKIKMKPMELYPFINKQIIEVKWACNATAGNINTDLLLTDFL